MRAEYKQIKYIHESKKSTFDNLKIKLANERKELENDNDLFQRRWRTKEREYHYFLSVNELVGADIIKSNTEEIWRTGNGRLLPDFMSLKDLYEHKLDQDELLLKSLRMEQRKMKENESESQKQVRFQQFTI
jgi:hypothetical protein